MATETHSKSKNSQLIPLTRLDINEGGKVSHIHAGHRATQRLSGMGIVPGTKITVLSRAPFQGPIQISVKGTRLALGRGLAQKIIVEVST